MSPLFRDILSGCLFMFGVAFFVVMCHHTPDDFAQQLAQRMEVIQ